MTWMRRIVVWTLVSVGVVLLVVVGGGALLPVEHSAARSRDVAASPTEVWALIAAPETYPDWRPDVERVERLPDRDGRAAWREHGAESITFETVESDSPARLVTRIADEGLPFGGRWTIELVADGDEVTTVIITEDGEVYHPVYRFVSRFVIGHEATMERYLDALQARLGRP